MEIHERLVDVFRQVFDDETLRLTDETTADDIEGWDSVAHINLMFSIEQAFGVQFNDQLVNFRFGELELLCARKDGQRLFHRSEVICQQSSSGMCHLKRTVQLQSAAPQTTRFKMNSQHASILGHNYEGE